MIPATISFCLGIDVAKDSLAVHLLDRQQRGTIFKMSIENSEEALRSLLPRFAEHAILPETVLVVMEATGVYWETAAYTMHTLGCVVSVVNPAQVKDFARAILRRGKTDPMDAQLIARFGLTIDIHAWAPPDAELKTLRALMRQREDYVLARVQERNRTHAKSYEHDTPKLVRTLLKTHLRQLDRFISAIEAEVKKILREAPDYKHSMAILESIPGVGFITATTVLTETWNMEAFSDPAQLAAYAGIAPRPNESGDSKKTGHISKIGNARIRKAFYLAAISAVKSKHFKPFYARLRAQGKPAKVALIAVAHKLLKIAFTLLERSEHFDPAKRPQLAKA